MTLPPQHRSSALTRRTLLAGGAAAGLGLALGACGDDTSRAGEAASAADSAGTFPARVPHKYGSTTVRKAPQRVATYGGGDVDTLLALGIVPVLIPDIEPSWKAKGGVGPWARSRLGAARPGIAGIEEVQFERVASARPDLITAVEYDLKRGDYDKLAALAPTIPPPKGFAAYTVPWDTMALQLGQALGRRPAAQRLVDTARAQRAAAAKDNPAFARTRTVLVDPDDEGGVYIFAPEDVRTRFLRDLGLNAPAEIDALFGKQFYAQISAERLDLLDTADLIVLVGVRDAPTKTLLASRVWKNLKNVREGRLVTIDDVDLANAMSYSTVLSTPYQLDALVPRLRQAVAA